MTINCNSVAVVPAWNNKVHETRFVTAVAGSGRRVEHNWSTGASLGGRPADAFLAINPQDVGARSINVARWTQQNEQGGQGVPLSIIMFDLVHPVRGHPGYRLPCNATMKR